MGDHNRRSSCIAPTSTTNTASFTGSLPSQPITLFDSDPAADSVTYQISNGLTIPGTTNFTAFIGVLLETHKGPEIKIERVPTGTQAVFRDNRVRRIQAVFVPNDPIVGSAIDLTASITVVACSKPCPCQPQCKEEVIEEICTPPSVLPPNCCKQSSSQDTDISSETIDEDSDCSSTTVESEKADKPAKKHKDKAKAKRKA
jgi:hypothetical protein